MTLLMLVTMRKKWTRRLRLALLATMMVLTVAMKMMVVILAVERMLCSREFMTGILKS